MLDDAVAGIGSLAEEGLLVFVDGEGIGLKNSEVVARAGRRIIAKIQRAPGEFGVHTRATRVVRIRIGASDRVGAVELDE